MSSVRVVFDPQVVVADISQLQQVVGVTSNSGLQQAISDVSGRVQANEAAIDIIDASLADISGTLDHHFTLVSGNITSISGLIEKDTQIDASLADISGTLDYHFTLVSGNITSISGLIEKDTQIDASLADISGTLDYHFTLVSGNNEDISAIKDALIILNNNREELFLPVEALQVKSLYDDIQETFQMQETFETLDNEWRINGLTNELNYNGSEYNVDHLLLSSKQYTVGGGFNFSCKVTLANADVLLNVLGYNVAVNASGIVAGFPTIDASGTTDTETEIVMVKDQDTSKVRVWVNGTEDTTTVYPDFTGGHLAVIPNPNATFSEVRLTDTTVDLGIYKIINNFNNVQVATFQASNPVTQADVDTYDKVNVVIRNQNKGINPLKDVSETGYILKVGAAHYYQITPGDTIEDLVTTLKQYGNITLGIDLKLGGVGNGSAFISAAQNLITPADKAVTLSLKYYSRNVSDLRERLTHTEEGSPYITWDSLTPATQTLLLAAYQQTLPTLSDEEIIDIIKGQVQDSLLKVVNLIAYGSRPLQSAPEFINALPSAVINQTNPTGNFTATNIESYSQLSVKLDQFDYSISNNNLNTYATYSFETAALKQAILTEFAQQGPHIFAELIPQQLLTNDWTINTLDKEAVEAVITNPNSFPTYAEFEAAGLSVLADQFVALLDQIPPGGNGLNIFNSLSYKTFVENVLLQNAMTGKTITINDLNGDYTPNMGDLQPDDYQKFRQALAMKENADVESAITIPHPDRFFYIVFGLSPGNTTNAVSWSYLPTDRYDNSVWTYTRVVDRFFGSYTDTATRTETSVTFHNDILNIPQNVITAFSTFYSFILDNTALQGDKYLIRYTGVLEYYGYVDMTPETPTFRILVAVLDATITDDANRIWVDPITLFKAGYSQLGQTPPPDDKLNYKVYKTWAEAQARLVDLATPVAP